MKAIIAAVTLLIAAPASAERYGLISYNPASGALAAIDLSSISEVNGKPRAWTLTIAATDAIAKPFYVRALVEFDCQALRSRDLAAQFFHADGSPIMDEGEKPWSYKAPNTVGYSALRIGCGLETVSEENVENATVAALIASFMADVRDVKTAK